MGKKQNKSEYCSLVAPAWIFRDIVRPYAIAHRMNLGEAICELVKIGAAVVAAETPFDYALKQLEQESKERLTE